MQTILRTAMGVAAALVATAYSVSGQVITNVFDDFTSYNASLWTTNGPVQFGGDPNHSDVVLMYATYGQLAGIRSVGTFSGASKDLTLTALVSPYLAAYPDAFVGFLDSVNWGGNNTSPNIDFRSDQGNGDWYIQPNGALIDTGVKPQANQVLQIYWAMNRLQFRIDNGNNGSWDYTFATNLTVTGSQHIQMGEQGGSIDNFKVDYLLVTIPEPSALWLGGLGLAAVGWRRWRR